MNRKQLIKEYLEFFKSKGHKEIKNSSLVPENDSTVLFTTAGMHPLVPYLLGEKHLSGKKLTNVQRCIRTQDIEEVGDTYHHTFFEMLGNWSLGDYFKKEAIEMSFEFLIKVLKLPLNRLAFTVFEGDKDSVRDIESFEIWNSLGVSEKRIVFLSKKDNWWGPAGEIGPCGPDTEIFYWKPNEIPAPEIFDPSDKNWVEIWNDVLMGYVKNKEGKIVEAEQKNIDTGMGVERTVAVLNSLEDNYLAEMWKPIIEKIERFSKVSYDSKLENKISMRIIADHIKASCFILGDGVVPSNSGQGYVLRRLIRRAVKYGKYNPNSDLNLENFICEVAKVVFEIYDDYEILKKNKEFILEELRKEEEKFNLTINQGERVLRKFFGLEGIEKSKRIDGGTAFLLYQSYGYPIELTKEFAKMNGLEVDMKEFEEELKQHQELSRTASAGAFKSGLADNSEQTTKLHTATHLLNQALREVLRDKNIFQKGSNITAERLRFDFNFDRKLTNEELKKVEDLVNEKISQGLEVVCEEMDLNEAKEREAQGVFDSKYSEKVKVYSVGDFSKEICAGPHVLNLKELGKFKVLTEESSSFGVRRIKAILE
jgi:alanyl-tRNA synthetase